MQPSPLVTVTDPHPAGRPVVLLHDRWGSTADWDAFAVPSDAYRIRVRGARGQSDGVRMVSHYWFIGRNDRPELTTIGDALAHLETLILTLDGPAPVVVGRGQGGVMAACLGLIRPDLLAGVAVIDAEVPGNFDRFPVELAALAGLPFLLCDKTPAGSHDAIATLGGRLTRGSADDTDVFRQWWMDSLHA